MMSSRIFKLWSRSTGVWPAERVRDRSSVSLWPCFRFRFAGRVIVLVSSSSCPWPVKRIIVAPFQVPVRRARHRPRVIVLVSVTGEAYRCGPVSGSGSPGASSSSCHRPRVRDRWSVSLWPCFRFRFAGRVIVLVSSSSCPWPVKRIVVALFQVPVRWARHRPRHGSPVPARRVLHATVLQVSASHVSERRKRTPRGTRGRDGTVGSGGTGKHRGWGEGSGGGRGLWRVGGGDWQSISSNEACPVYQSWFNVSAAVSCHDKCILVNDNDIFYFLLFQLDILINNCKGENDNCTSENFSIPDKIRSLRRFLGFRMMTLRFACFKVAVALRPWVAGRRLPPEPDVDQGQRHHESRPWHDLQRRRGGLRAGNASAARINLCVNFSRPRFNYSRRIRKIISLLILSLAPPKVHNYYMDTRLTPGHRAFSSPRTVWVKLTWTKKWKCI